MTEHYHQYPGEPTCRYCGTIIERHVAATRFCGSPACEARRVQDAARAVYKAKWDDYIYKQREGIENSKPELVQAVCEMDAKNEDIAIGVLPKQTQPLTALPEDRRREFLEHLQSVINEAFADDVPDGALTGRAQAEADEAPMVDAACGTCWGHCCTLGGQSNAFLSSTTINVFRARNPDADADEVAAYYRDRIPDESIRHSCVFHGAMGCTLDRESRSMICNSFHCNPMTQLYQRMKERGTDRAILIAHGDDRVPRVGLYDGSDTHRLMEYSPGPDADPTEQQRIVAAALSQIPDPLPQEAQRPEYPPERSCKWCGAMIDVHKASTTQSCGAAFCEQRRLRSIYGSGE